MKLTFVLWPSVARHCTTSRMESKAQLTDAQWDLIEDLFPWKPPASLGGRPQVPPRACFEGILWILRTGARWKDLPDCFPSFTTCWRRHREWTEAGIFEEAWGRLLDELDARGELNLEEAMADGSFSSAKKGALRSAKPNEAKAQS